MLGAFGAVFVGAIVTAIVAPTVGRGDRRLVFAVVAGIAAIVFVAALIAAGTSAPIARLAAAAGIVGLFGLALAGIARGLPGDATPFLVAGAGIALLASPFVVDAWLESASGAARPVVLFLALELNPIAAIASSLLDVDWLRQSVIYEAVRLGAFHRFEYPSPLAHAIGWAMVACTLAVAPRRRFESP